MSTREEDLAREIEAHLALEADRLVADGLSRADADQAARRAFGNVVRVREDFHERRRWAPIEPLARDLRYAWRGLWRSPSFAATTILTLATGLALITVLFTIFNAYVLRPFAVRDPGRLHEIAWRAPDSTGRTFTWPEYSELRDRHDLFDEVMAEATQLVSVDGRQLTVGFVSANYFTALGSAVAAGRALGAEDGEVPGSAPVAVLSDQGWARLFNRDPGVLGRSVTINHQALLIIGVLRPPFSGLDDTPRDFWVPVTMYPVITGRPLFAVDGPRPLGVVARLRPDVSVKQAGAALAVFMSRFPPGRATAWADLQPKATPVPFSIGLVQMLLPVFVAFGLILATACANVSNVMLTRANARHREIGVRLALGASRGRIVRQLMTEGLVIALLAGLTGLGLAAVLLRVGLSGFLHALPAPVAASTRVVPLDLDFRVFLFALSIAAAATLVFALVPAWRATRPGLVAALRGEPTGSLRTSSLRSLLVVVQVAVSLVVLIPAATLIRNGAAVQRIDPGIDSTGVTATRVRGTAPALLARAAAVVAANPRIERTAVASRRPLSEDQQTVEMAPSVTTAVTRVPYTFVSPDYFGVLRIPVLTGRTFREADAAAEAPVAMISAAAAEAFWPGADPIGRTLRIAPATAAGNVDLAGHSTVVVIGVVQDIVSGLVFDGRDAAHVYLPTHAGSVRATTLLARGRTAGDAPAAVVEESLRSVDPDPLAFETMTFADVMAMQIFPLRIASWVASLLGAVALLLSVAGLYGVLSYSLSQRTREIGIRMALGATGRGVVRLVMRQSAALLGTGMVAGLVVAFALMSLLRSMVLLQNVSFLDVVAFAAGPAIVAGAGAVASFFPARRASRIDPARTLRSEG